MVSQPIFRRGITWHTQSWAAVDDRLAQFRGAQLAPMRSFIAEIAASPYAQGLFPCSSMDSLRIARIPDFSDYEPHIWVWYNSATRQFRFTYFDAPGTGSPCWETRAPAMRGFPHFEHLLLRRLRWFTRHSAGEAKNEGSA